MNIIAEADMEGTFLITTTKGYYYLNNYTAIRNFSPMLSQLPVQCTLNIQMENSSIYGSNGLIKGGYCKG